MPWSMSTKTRAFIRKKYKVAQNEKKYVGFHIPKIWLNFSGTFYQAYKAFISEE